MEITPFDQSITSTQLQLIKLMIPYLPPDMQRMIGIYVKITELSHLLSFSRQRRQQTVQMESFLKEIEPYLPAESKEKFSEFQQFFEMFEMMQNIDFSNVMDSMNFNDFSNMFSSERKDAHE